ncbi:MAG: hypothetical protein JO358_21975 [Alphaproteobacteria bacterium]|nr:hypothetical protein [Alphaproteobacteria bacterium]
MASLTLSDASGKAQNSEFALTQNSASVFAISGNNLVTARTSIPVGIYSVRANAVAANVWFSGSGTFAIAVTA